MSDPGVKIGLIAVGMPAGDLDPSLPSLFRQILHDTSRDLYGLGER